jgi:hypothetical protein
MRFSGVTRVERGHSAYDEGFWSEPLPLFQAALSNCDHGGDEETWARHHLRECQRPLLFRISL